jgi:hypothetical protein
MLQHTRLLSCCWHMRLPQPAHLVAAPGLTSQYNSCSSCCAVVCSPTWPGANMLVRRWACVCLWTRWRTPEELGGRRDEVLHGKDESQVPALGISLKSRARSGEEHARRLRHLSGLHVGKSVRAPRCKPTPAPDPRCRDAPLPCHTNRSSSRGKADTFSMGFQRMSLRSWASLFIAIDFKSILSLIQVHCCMTHSLWESKSIECRAVLPLHKAPEGVLAKLICGSVNSPVIMQQPDHLLTCFSTGRE